MTDSKLQLYHHYSETCQIRNEAKRDRNKYMKSHLVFLFLYMMFSAFPEDMYEWAQGYIVGRLSARFPVSICILTAMTLVFFLCYQILYYQKCVYIERLFLYIKTIEGQLGLSREGGDKNGNQPFFSLFIGEIYKFLLPGISFVFLINSLLYIDKISFYWCVRLFLIVFSSIISILYVRFQYVTDKKHTGKVNVK